MAFFLENHLPEDLLPGLEGQGGEAAVKGGVLLVQGEQSDAGGDLGRHRVRVLEPGPVRGPAVMEGDGLLRQVGVQMIGQGGVVPGVFHGVILEEVVVCLLNLVLHHRQGVLHPGEGMGKGDPVPGLVDGELGTGKKRHTRFQGEGQGGQAAGPPLGGPGEAIAVDGPALLRVQTVVVQEPAGLLAISFPAGKPSSAMPTLVR